MHIVSTGMVSGLAYGAEANAVMMHLEYDTFEQTSFSAPYTNQPIIGSYIEGLEGQGASRLVEMAYRAMEDLQLSITDYHEAIDVVFCLSNRGNQRLNKQRVEEFQKALVERGHSYPAVSKCCRLSNAVYIQQGRTGFGEALAHAQKHLSERESKFLVIVGVDSLINNECISSLLGDSTDSGRLLIEDNADGMIIGEAAAAVLLQATNTQTPGMHIAGIGSGQEPAPLHSEEVSRADGLVKAVESAATQAGISVQETDFRIAGVTGESYFFTEDSNMLFRCLKRPKEVYDIWHTTDKIGEVGAATGASMIVLGYWAAQKSLIPGNKILCHISDENTQRIAFILNYKRSVSK